MQILRTFFHALRQSSTSVRYYSTLLKTSIKFSWKYFFGLHLIAAAVLSITLALAVSRFDARRLGNRIKEIYPNELIITTQGGRIAVNQPLPYHIPFPNRDQDRPSILPLYLLTFTSDAQVASPSDVFAQRSMAVITESTIYIQQGSPARELRAYQIPKDLPPFTVQSSDVTAKIDSIAQHPFFRYRLFAPVIGLLSFLAFYPVMLLAGLFTTALYALFALILDRILTKTTLSYGKLFQLTIHALTPILLLSLALRLLRIELLEGMRYLIAYLIWIYVILKNIGARTRKTALVRSRRSR